MTGDLQYCINVLREDGQEPLPLQVVDNFTKQSRPQSWKGMDLKVQRHLPLLGHCGKALSQWNENSLTVVATVSMRLTRESYRE